MKKFEEEVKRPITGPVTELNNAMQAVVKQYREHREYSRLLETENQRLRAENLAVKTLMEAAKQENVEKQQSEIPEFVAEWIEERILGTRTKEEVLRDILTCAIDKEFRYIFPIDVAEYALENPIKFLKAVSEGYTVAKEKRFYLKNKLTGDCLARCLARGSNGLYVEVTEKWLTRKEQTSYQLLFTQQEIDSMAAESYEKVEVEE